MRAIFHLLFAVLFLSGFSGAALAQTSDAALPTLPDPIQALVSEGAQVRYMGKEHGLDSWLTVKNGQQQYFYVLPNQEAFLMGVMFDKSGRLVTVDQVRRLQQGGDTLLDDLDEGDSFAGLSRNKDVAAADKESFKFKTPSEKLYADLEGSNWVALGKASAPVVYSFVDPQCPHCHALIQNLRKEYLPNGNIQLRIIPVGFKDETMKQSAFLLAAPNPQERWYAHMDGDAEALPAKADISDQGVQRNLSIMQGWQFSVTPLLVYRNASGVIKIIRGQPKDLKDLINDIGGLNSAAAKK